MIAPVRARAALAARVALAPPAHTEVPCAYQTLLLQALSHRQVRSVASTERCAPQTTTDRCTWLGKEIKQAADMAACMSSDKRHLPREQNPALLSSCQDFLAIELFSSGTKG